MLGYFDQSARSIESRCMVTQKSRYESQSLKNLKNLDFSHNFDVSQNFRKKIPILVIIVKNLDFSQNFWKLLISVKMSKNLD